MSLSKTQGQPQVNEYFRRRRIKKFEPFQQYDPALHSSPLSTLPHSPYIRGHSPAEGTHVIHTLQGHVGTFAINVAVSAVYQLPAYAREPVI